MQLIIVLLKMEVTNFSKIVCPNDYGYCFHVYRVSRGALEWTRVHRQWPTFSSFTIPHSSVGVLDTILLR